MLAGGVLTKVLQSRMANHSILILGSLLMGVCSWLFSLTLSNFWLGVWLFLAGVGYSLVEIIVNVCNLMVNDP
jgi:hypothetical protein